MNFDTYYNPLSKKNLENIFTLPGYSNYTSDSKKEDNKHKLIYECKVDYVGNIKLSKVKHNRAGVIIYTIYKGKLYFILGIDSKTRDITDFGGGVAFKSKNENSITGGLRELKEESLGIFGTIKSSEINKCLAVYDEDTIIIFVPLKINLQNKYMEFLNRVKNYPNPEVIDLRFFDKRQFIELINGKDTNEKRMYHRIKKLLIDGYTRHNFMKLL